MPADVSSLHRLTHRCAGVEAHNPAVAGAWSIGPGVVARLGQLDQGRVLAQRDRFRARCDAAHRTGEQSATETAAPAATASRRPDRLRPLRRSAAATTAARWLIDEGEDDVD